MQQMKLSLPNLFAMEIMPVTLLLLGLLQLILLLLDLLLLLQLHLLQLRIQPIGFPYTYVLSNATNEHIHSIMEAPIGASNYSKLAPHSRGGHCTVSLLYTREGLGTSAT